MEEAQKMPATLPPAPPLGMPPPLMFRPPSMMMGGPRLPPGPPPGMPPRMHPGMRLPSGPPPGNSVFSRRYITQDCEAETVSIN